MVEAGENLAVIGTFTMNSDYSDLEYDSLRVLGGEALPYQYEPMINR